MTWVFIGLVVVVVAAVAAVAVGHGDGLAVAAPDRREVAVPADRLLTAADLTSVGFSVGLRGYRMDEVDDLLARLGAELTERDRRLAAAGDPHTAVDSMEAVDSPQAVGHGARVEPAAGSAASPTDRLDTPAPDADRGEDPDRAEDLDAAIPADAPAEPPVTTPVQQGDDRPPMLRGSAPGGRVGAAGEPAARW